MVGQLPSLFSFFAKNTYPQATSRGRAAARARGGGARAGGQYACRDVVAVADARQRGVSTTLLTGGMNAPRRQRGGASASYLPGGSLCLDRTLRWEGLPPLQSGGKPRCDVHPILDKVDVLGMKLTFLLDKILYFCYNRIIKSRIGLLP